MQMDAFIKLSNYPFVVWFNAFNTLCDISWTIKDLIPYMCSNILNITVVVEGH